MTNIPKRLHPLFTTQHNKNLLLTKQNHIPIINSPFLPIASYGGAFVLLWALHLPEVPPQVRELQEIQVAQTAGQTSLYGENCHRLPAAGKTPSLLGWLTLPRKDGGNERPQCHPGNERPQCLSSGNERPGSPNKRS